MVDSIIWTEAEAKYLKVLLNWDPVKRDARKRSKPEEKKPIKGEFRILVVGGKGTGKTSIMQRFCKNTFPPTPDPFYERGGRHTIEIDDNLYLIDALEMASKHLSSDAFLSQALAITEAAVLVYDVTSPDSFKLAQGVYDFLRDNRGGREYGILLVGNKSDVEDEERAVSWAEGRKAAMGFGSLLKAQTAAHAPGFGEGTTSPRLAADGMAVGMGMGGVMGRVNGVDGDTGRAVRERRSMSISVASGDKRGMVGSSRASRRTVSSRGGSGSIAHGSLYLQPKEQNHNSATSAGRNSKIVRKRILEKNGSMSDLRQVERVDSPHASQTAAEDAKTAQTREVRPGIVVARSSTSISVIVNTPTTGSGTGTGSTQSPLAPGHAPPPPPLSLPHSNGSTASSGLKSQGQQHQSFVSSSATATQAVPSPRPATVSFLECSAKSGDNVGAIFEHIGREVLRLRRINQERKGEAERLARERIDTNGGGGGYYSGGGGGGGRGGGRGRRGTGRGRDGSNGGGIWKSLTTPWFKRQQNGYGAEGPTPMQGMGMGGPQRSAGVEGW